MRRLDAFCLAAATVTLAAIAMPARAVPLGGNPIVIAVRRGDCEAAVQQLNAALNGPDAVTDFLAGRMLNEGVCVRQDRTAATDYLSRAADLGNKSAKLDYAAKVGVGEGSDQSYERAGMLCRDAGLDPQAHLSTYSLGYACTVGTLAAEQLRVSLPKGAWRANSGELVVSFQPATARMQIRSTPAVGAEPAQLGSHLHGPLFNAPQEIGKAWRSALAAAPKPDPAHLDDETIQLTLDVDMALEAGQDAIRQLGGRNYGTLRRDELAIPNTPH